MTESEIAKIAEEYRKKALIEIPDTVNFKAKSMEDGYEQITIPGSGGTKPSTQLMIGENEWVEEWRAN